MSDGTDDRRDVGQRSEALVESYLRTLGWTIVARNVSYRCGELDIIAHDGEQLVFVEVRSRRGAGRGRPEDTVRRPKQRRLTRAAGLFLQQPRWRAASARFDIVGVDAGRGVVLEHHRGAFDATV